jgi:hypothetical protein
MATCIGWAEERIEECNDWEDQGYNDCEEYHEDCCDWWPCSWACEVVSWVCVAFVWVTKWVCVGWTVITTAVCVLWDVLTLIVGAIFVTLESIFGWVLSAFAFLIELIMAIPGFGTFVRWLFNIITHIFWIVVGLGDAFLGLIGIRPEKILRVCTVILSDEAGNPVATEEFARQMLQLAADIYKRDANVRLQPVGPFKYSNGFVGAATVDTSWFSINTNPQDPDTLDVPCNEGGAGAEWGLTGSKFQWLASTSCFFGAWRRTSGYGAPVSCFIIRSIPGALGCALWITDYATIVGEKTAIGGTPTSPRTLGHELGHACNLWHVCSDNDVRNLMGISGSCDPAGAAPNRADPRMANWQVLLVRASKHVSYF